MREHVVQAAVKQFNDVREELAPLLEELGSKALVALVRQHHHLTDQDQGWAFDSIRYTVGHDARHGIFVGELTESRQASEGQTMKRVTIFLDPESIDSIEIETFND